LLESNHYGWSHSLFQVPIYNHAFVMQDKTSQIVSINIIKCVITPPIILSLEKVFPSNIIFFFAIKRAPPSDSVLLCISFQSYPFFGMFQLSILKRFAVSSFSTLRSNQEVIYVSKVHHLFQ